MNPAFTDPRKRQETRNFGENTPIRTVDLRSSRPLTEELAAVRAELAQLSQQADTERSDATLSADEARLRELEPHLQAAMLDARQRERDVVRLRREQADLSEQLKRLDEDLNRNKDAARLKRFGGEPWTEDDRDCPTCHQPFPSTLIGTLDRPTMTVEQNIAYIEQQREVVQAAQGRAAAEIELTVEQQAAARRASMTRALRSARSATRSYAPAGCRQPPTCNAD